MRRAIITGITGQDGSYLAEHLLSLGYTVKGLVRRPLPLPMGHVEAIRSRISLAAGDLTDAEWVEQEIRDFGPTEVYHLAFPRRVASRIGDSPEVERFARQVVPNLLRAIERHSPTASFLNVIGYDCLVEETRTTIEANALRPGARIAALRLQTYASVEHFRKNCRLNAKCCFVFPHGSVRANPDHPLRRIARRAASAGLGLPPRNGRLALTEDFEFGLATDQVQEFQRVIREEVAMNAIVRTSLIGRLSQFAQKCFDYVGRKSSDHVRYDDYASRIGSVRPAAGDLPMPVPDPAASERALAAFAAEMVEAEVARLRKLTLSRR